MMKELPTSVDKTDEKPQQGFTTAKYWVEENVIMMGQRQEQSSAID